MAAKRLSSERLKNVRNAALGHRSFHRRRERARMSDRVVIISINASWNIVNFRSGLVRALRSHGYRVIALAPPDQFSDRLGDLGAEYVPLEMDGRGTSPVRDLGLLARYYRTLRAIRPDVYLGYTAKPNIYGSLAAQALGIPVINNVAGLGVAFLERGWLNRTVRSLYRLAFRRSAQIFFQNPDDLALFETGRLVDAGRTSLLPGSGVDLTHFCPPAESPMRERVTFLLVARLLWAKGVKEFVEAAQIVRNRYPHTRFQIAGIVDDNRREAIPLKQVLDWAASGAIEYLGPLQDVRPAMAEADCIVLPSYYPEGTPRSLLEGAAMGMPLITCEVPGCREVVREGVNGFLCKPRDARSLADKMLRIIDLGPDARAAMGRASRREAEERFDEKIVVRRYLDAIAEALDAQSADR